MSKDKFSNIVGDDDYNLKSKVPGEDMLGKNYLSDLDKECAKKGYNLVEFDYDEREMTKVQVNKPSIWEMNNG